jgi:hypothetical protein
MENIVTDTPNVPVDTVPVKEASQGLEAIAQKMAAMRNIAERNRPAQPEPTGAGSSSAAAEESPAVPQTDIDSDIDLVEPEADDALEESSLGHDDTLAPEETEVSAEDSQPADIIDFLEFAEEHPNAKFRFKRNGKDIEVDAKKAAAILGQGAAVSEDARKLKIERAEFDEYLNNKRGETEGLILAMEFTVQPQLQKAYDEILKVQGYQNTFQQQLAQTADPATRARITANIQQNERYLEQQAQTINQLKPRIDEFYKMRSSQVQQVIDASRKNFQDKELRNEYVYNEIRDKVSKNWAGAKRQLVPGVDNIDLIASDEHILGLLRDGLKFRDRPKAKQAGGSLAALTQKRSGSTITGGKSQFSDLESKAKAGDRKAQDNLLVAKMQALRSQRGGR